LKGLWNATLARNVGLRCGWRSGYSAFAKTLRAFGRIDFAARLRWLFYLLNPCTGDNDEEAKEIVKKVG
jgi:hypothetical protein